MRLNHSGTAAGPSTTRSAQLAAVCVSLTSFDLSACALSGEMSMSEQQRRRGRGGGEEGGEEGGGGGGGGGEEEEEEEKQQQQREEMNGRCRRNTIEVSESPG